MKKFIFISLFFLISITNIYAQDVVIEVKQHIASNEDIKDPPRNFQATTAIIDVEYILDKATVMQSIRMQINDISNHIQKEMSLKERELKNIESQLVEERGTISESEFDQKILNFNKNVSEAQKLTQQKKSSLERAHSEAVAVVNKHVIKIIDSIAKKYNINLVLPTSAVIYADNKLNITLEVLTELNNSLKHIEVDYKV